MEWRVEVMVRHRASGWWVEFSPSHGLGFGPAATLVEIARYIENSLRKQAQWYQERWRG
jgi:hypothetical protein